MRRYQVQHKAVYSPTDWPNWANPFCLLEVHLVPRLSSYWKLQLPQGRWLDSCAEAFFILFRLFLFTILWKLRLDQQNAHSKWLFSCMCLNASRTSKVYMLVDIAPLTSRHISNIENLRTWELWNLQWTAMWKGGVACWTSKVDQSRYGFIWPLTILKHSFYF